jgi:2-keto-3-deoxy-L-rhamnonate aldolase RhmA
MLQHNRAERPLAFRQRLLAKEHLIGTFVKTPTVHATEILGSLGFDFVVIDEEHAPFDRAATDVALLAARAAGVAGLVRVRSAAPEHLLSVLDCGASGVLVPHVSSVRQAKDVAEACRYRDGRRGYSGSPRSAAYGGSSMQDYIAAADAAVSVIAQIEDAEALDDIDGIAAVAGIDALFIGRGDLAVALNAESSGAPAVRAASERIAAAARSAGKPVCVFVGSVAEATWLKEQGASAFVVSSDQGFLRRAAAQALTEYAALASSQERTPR